MSDQCVACPQCLLFRELTAGEDSTDLIESHNERFHGGRPVAIEVTHTIDSHARLLDHAFAGLLR